MFFNPPKMVLIRYANSGRIDHEVVSWVFRGLGLVHTVVGTIGWILILLAIFRHRPPDAAENERTHSTAMSRYRRTRSIPAIISPSE